MILRADPVAQAAVLSTSIQASFLLARLLDPRTAAPSEGRAGHRAFVFTDDLDVTNRLYPRSARRRATAAGESSRKRGPGDHTGFLGGAGLAGRRANRVGPEPAARGLAHEFPGRRR